jgi:tetratricopeptide (TPR) repeat protein
MARSLTAAIGDTRFQLPAFLFQPCFLPQKVPHAQVRPERLLLRSNKKIGAPPMAKETNEGKDLDIGELYTKSELFLEKNKTAVTVAVVAVLLIVGGVLGYRKFVTEPRTKEAQEMIWKAQYYFEIDSLDKALNGDGNYLGFLQVADEYGSTPTGKLAKFYVAVINHQQGNLEAALQYYKEADLDDDVLRVMATGNQGDVLVDLGRPKEAVDQFMKAADMVQSDYTTPMFLMKAGIVYEQQGDWKNAAKCFQRVARDYPRSPDANTAKKYAARAEAKAG